MNTVQIISMLGALLVLGAFWALQSGRVLPAAPGYQAVNLAGAVLLASTAAITGVWSFVVLNVVWALVAARGLLRGLRA